MDVGGVAEATTRLFDILLQEDAPGTILDSLARIVGETLEVDRSLIYDVSFERDEAECLTEWLNPLRPEITTTRANYPLALFRGAAALLFATHDRLESHAADPHPVLVADGASGILHESMSIRSLLWYPFAFRADGFYLFAFNHVTSHHPWQPTELEFMRSATRHVTMALLKISLIRERAQAEEALYAAQRIESLGLLAGGVAHDFNNLMVGVVSSADLLARRIPADSPLRPLVAQIMHSGKRASALAGQLLAFAGKGQPGVTTVDLPQVVRGTLQLVQSSMHGVRVEVSAAEVPPIDCNVSQLEQVIMNLVVNAGEAMQGRPGHVRIAVDVVELDEGIGHYATPVRPAPGRYARLEVADQGIGMDAATAKRIFDPFFSTKRAGRGLGLSAVLGILKLHGGAIQIASTPEIGTTFQVVWPLSLLPPPSPVPLAEGTDDRRPIPTILCIDDDEVVLRALEQVFVAEGFNVIVATGGALGISLFDERVDRIGAVVLDLTMPPPAGAEVLRYLRRVRPQLPIVLISGFTTDDSIRDALDPITKFVAKPFVAEDLMSAVRAVLSAAVTGPSRTSP